MSVIPLNLYSDLLDHCKKIFSFISKILVMIYEYYNLRLLVQQLKENSFFLIITFSTVTNSYYFSFSLYKNQCSFTQFAMYRYIQYVGNK